MADPVGDETARAMRKLWFDYLDTIAPIRPKLHAYCLRLTGSVWDAEDLLQDTLLRGFGVIGRGDLHGAESPFAKPQAYLSQVATNLWIDRIRRSRRETLAADPDAGAQEQKPVITPAAGAALFDRTTPQERAAVVLKDVFDFSLAEIADVLSTTEGAVKTALHRGRAKLSEERETMAPRNTAASADLVDRFVAAFNARDIPAVTALLLETAVFEVQGVGGGRGRKGIWIAKSIENAWPVEAHLFEGEKVIVHLSGRDGRKVLSGVTRLEETDGGISRVRDYYYCPETLALVGEAIGLPVETRGYHQPANVVIGMIASTALPWHTA